MDDLDDLRKQHQSLRASMPHAWNAFFARFGSLRPIQLASMPSILSGKSALVTAPTAGGKTEAIAAPICELMARHRWPGLSVLLITPTRALVNDLYRRLEQPLSTMKIGLGRKTGDHPGWDNPNLQFLVTTPESTESLLTFHRDALAGIKAVAIDEVHLLDGTARGDQLRLVLQRLSRFLQHRGGDHFVGLQRVAMSATVAEPGRVADAFLGPGATVVSVPGQRAIESKIVTAAGDDRERILAAVEAIETFRDVRKVLVFVNSRTLVDVAASHFKVGRFAKAPIYGHHGSLSKHYREDVEQRFKNDECAVCVATMTLEIGIDIGDIDLVVCLDPPFSLSSFLQRIGRGCRRLKGITRVLCVARDRESELIFHALLNQSQIGMPNGPRIPFRRSVLIQQFLAYLRQVDRHRRTSAQFRQALSSDDIAGLAGESQEQFLDELTADGLLVRDAKVYQPGAKGWSFIESSSIYTNIAPVPFETTLIDADSGKPIVSVAAVRTQDGGIRVAGKSYEVLPGGNASRQLVRASDQHGDGPRYHSRSLPYSFDIGAALSNLLGYSRESIACLRVGDGVAVFTWLGKLLNLALAKSMKELGVTAQAGAFHIRASTVAVDSAIELLRKASALTVAKNPMAEIDLGKVVDLGPYFDYLTPRSQRLAQQDWLDVRFLTSWAESLHQSVEITVDSDIGRDLLVLV